MQVFVIEWRIIIRISDIDFPRLAWSCSCFSSSHAREMKLQVDGFQTLFSKLDCSAGTRRR